MTELIKVTKNESGSNVVSARELYSSLGYESNKFSRWSKSKISENDFAIEGQDWVGLDINVQGNETKDFVISLDFAKRLAMMAKTQKGEEIRTYFIECEKQLKKPKSRLEIARENLALIEELDSKEQLILEQKTKLDDLVEYVSILKVAKFNKISENVFNWRLLKQQSELFGYKIKKAESPRYGFQNLYHIDCFMACYPQFKYNLLENNLLS